MCNLDAFKKYDLDAKKVLEVCKHMKGKFFASIIVFGRCSKILETNYFSDKSLQAVQAHVSLLLKLAT